MKCRPCPDTDFKTSTAFILNCMGTVFGDLYLGECTCVYMSSFNSFSTVFVSQTIAGPERSSGWSSDQVYFMNPGLQIIIFTFLLCIFLALYYLHYLPQILVGHLWGLRWCFRYLGDFIDSNSFCLYGIYILVDSERQ